LFIIALTIIVIIIVILYHFYVSSFLFKCILPFMQSNIFLTSAAFK